MCCLRLHQTLGAFWKNIQRQYKSGTDIFQGSKSWAGRGMAYRTLVEPLDIANWYYGGKNTGSGHYVDDIPEDNELVDNHRRPGRYILLQQKEMEMFDRKPASSLRTARELKILLEENSWETYTPADQR